MLAVVSALMLAGCRDRQQRNRQAEVVPQEQAAEMSEEEKATLVKVGQEAPDFTVTMLDGSEYKLSDLKGKVVMLNFWATWCPPCRQEFMRMQTDVVDRFAGKDFVLLAASREEDRETVAGFMEKQGYKFNVGLDPERKIYSLYASNYIPRNFIIDKKGNVAWASVGYTAEEFDEMLTLVDELVKRK